MRDTDEMGKRNQETYAAMSTNASQAPRLREQILICTVGLPRSGKTTWAQRQGYPIVCPDEIRIALYGEPRRLARQAEPMVWTIATLMVRSLFGAGHERVILDACNNTRERRDPWSQEFDTRFMVIETSVETCLTRALENGRRDIIPVIGRMASQHEPVDPAAENLWYLPGL